MPEIRGRAGDRKNATIELDGEDITLIVMPGFFSGGSRVESINLDDVKSIETGTGIKPFKDAQWVQISYDQGSIEFFSVNQEPLRELVSSVNRFLDEKACGAPRRDGRVGHRGG